MTKKSLPKNIWEIKERHQENSSLKWSIVKRVPAYSNITKKCLLCLHEKLETVNFLNPEGLLNKRSELVSKCLHTKSITTKQIINYFNIPVGFMQFYLTITLMLKEYFLRCNTIYLMIVEHETLSCKT